MSSKAPTGEQTSSGEKRLDSDGKKRRERRESNTASARRSRDKRIADLKEMQNKYERNAERIAHLERTAERLSHELGKDAKKPKKRAEGSGGQASSSQTKQIAPSNQAPDDKDRPPWFGEPFWVLILFAYFANLEVGLGRAGPPCSHKHTFNDRWI